jgi:hypothetical protein
MKPRPVAALAGVLFIGTAWAANDLASLPFWEPGVAEDSLGDPRCADCAMWPLVGDDQE